MKNDKIIRNAFKMKLKAGFEAEYEIRHNEIWPELAALLSDTGIQDYSIFLDKETLILFAVQKISTDFDMEYLPNHPIVKKWWAYMADIMDTNPDNSPVAVPLQEVFYLQ